MSENENDDRPIMEKEGNIDDYLQFLVHLANKTAMELGVTLNVGGLIVTGILISAHEYFTWSGESFAEGLALASGEKLEGPIEAFVSLAEKTKSLDAKETQYIHLKNTRYIFPDSVGIPSDQRGTYWRGKLSSIDGFSPVSLKSDSS